MKIIFLDIDGVLNSRDYNTMRPLSDESEYLERNWTAMIDPAAVARLNRLIAESGAKVVISSSWRYAFKLDEIRTILAARGFIGEIIDETPHYEDYKCRGDEIAAWLNYWVAEGVMAYVILDDTADMRPSQQSRFVNTKWAVGLQDEDVDRAIDILAAQPGGIDG